MADPFLLAHEVAPFYFDIGGRLSPISIRDQMVRGQVIIDRAAAAKLINAARPLLVVGAGAAGVTAAMHAVGRHGVPTTLMERGAVPFGVQLGCRSRWVDPLQYDWPVDHWDLGRYPWSQPPTVPLPWASDQPYLLALGWTTRFRRFLRAHRPLLSYWRGTTTRGMPMPLPHHMLRMSFNPPTRPSAAFGMVLSCVGFGVETTKPHATSTFGGFPFWTTDPYDLPNLGVPTAGSASGGPRVLISGAGDGALQDFLRILLTPAVGARAVVVAKDVLKGLPLRPGIEQQICSEEDRALREYAWSGSGGEDHAIHEALQEVHQRAADAALLDPAVGKAIDGMLRTPMPAVQLVFPCTHFGHCYGLNRFLVLLVATRLEKAHKLAVLKPQTAVTEVYCTHAAPSNPTACHGETHDAELAFCQSCAPIAPTMSARQGPFDVVIIRHGVNPPGPAIRFSIRHLRQIPPYRVVV